jgi:hypothetical protein
MRILFCGLLIAASAAAQQSNAQPAAPAPQTGVETEWDLRKLLDALVTGAARLKPLMEQVNPQNWSDKQGAASYMPQWKSAQNEIQYLAHSTQDLSKEPERLTLALETYFRLQAIQNAVGSLNEGIRRYQNPAVADLLQGAVVENATNRERLKAYITELAQTKEQELKIMDKEAQRCRAMLTKQPAPAPSRPGRKQ